MAILSTTLVSLLLTSSALAAPAVHGQSVRRNTRYESKFEKRGIRVEARRHIPKHAVIKRDTGAVVATNDGGGWIIPVLIGGQQVTLNVDTGSSDLWTASTLMPSDQQSTVTTGEIYDPSQSTTYVPMNGSTFDLSYADGSGASGPAVRNLSVMVSV